MSRAGSGTYHDVDAESREHAGRGRPLAHRVELRALERVARVQEQRAVDARVPRCLFPFASHGRLEPRETAAAPGRQARATRRARLGEVRVHVVGVQHEQPVKAAAGRRRRAQAQQQVAHDRPDGRHRVRFLRGVRANPRVCVCVRPTANAARLTAGPVVAYTRRPHRADPRSSYPHFSEEKVFHRPERS